MELRALTGDALEERHMDAFYGVLSEHRRQEMVERLLTQEFFLRLATELSDRWCWLPPFVGVALWAALSPARERHALRPQLGRGRRYRMLYFEACFYRAIDYAIEHGLARVEAGAQVRTRFQRGYLPSPTYSVHWIREPRSARRWRTSSTASACCSATRCTS